MRLDAHAAHEILPVHDAEHRVSLVRELHLPPQGPDVRADGIGDESRVTEHAQDEGGHLASPLRVVGLDDLIPAMLSGHRLPVTLKGSKAMEFGASLLCMSSSTDSKKSTGRPS